MAKKTIKAQMKQRRDTKANWAATNPVLLDGELGIVSDDPNLYKVGDGATAWNSLPFRGFDGTLAQELGTSPNAAISQKVVTDRLKEQRTGLLRLSEGTAISYKGGYSQLNLAATISKTNYGAYIFMVRPDDLNNNQVLFTIGDDSANKVFLQLNAGRLILHYTDANGGSALSSAFPINPGWHELRLQIREGNSAGPVLELIMDETSYILATQNFTWPDATSITIAALNTGQLPTQLTLAALIIESAKMVYYFANDLQAHTKGSHRIECLGVDLVDMTKYPYSLSVQRDEIGYIFNGVSSHLTFDNKQGITTTDGGLYFKFRVPKDITANQILFAWGSQLMVTLNNGLLQIYNHSNLGLPYEMTPYIGKIITLGLVKQNGSLTAYIDEKEILRREVVVDATEDVKTLSIGSYDGGAALFSALEFYSLTKTDSQNKVEWTVNPFSTPASMKDLAILIGGQKINTADPVNYLSTLPEYIYITTGLQYNLYIENLVQGYEALGYQMEIKNPTGDRRIRSMNRNIRFESAKVGAQPVTATLFDANGKTLQSAQLNLITSNPYAGSGTKQFIFCGDSTIDDATTGLYEHEGPEIVKQFYDNCAAFKGFTPLMLGSKKKFPPYYHEGNTGQASNWYIGPSSPFYSNGRLDFKNYVQNIIKDIPGATDSVDFFVYQIGINDLKNESSPDTVITNIKTLITALLADYPACQIVIGMPPSGCDADGWSAHFGDAARYKVFRNNMIEYQKLLIANFSAGRFAENVHVCNAGHFIDRKYGFPYTEEKESSRVDTLVFRHTDSVHPNKSGYDQMADAYFAFIKSLV